MIIRGNPVLRYTNVTARRVAACFHSEKQFLSTFKDTRMMDAAFGGLPEAQWRNEVLNPDPLGEQYVEFLQDISRHSTEHVSLLASGGWAWRGWHINSNPGEALSASWRVGSSCGASPLAHAR